LPGRHTSHRPVVARPRVARMPSAAFAYLLLTIALFTAAVLLGGCASGLRASGSHVLAIDSVRLTGAGHFIDLRYRVLDPERANAALGPGVKPLLIDEATGSVMAVPTTAKLGSLRQTRGEQRPNREYFVLFVNSAPLRPGSRVTAELGELRFEHLTVQ
jgi:hypothetical protein